MKILLVGEFSGVHTNLAAGLKKAGHTVNIAATGDGYKKFPHDFYFAQQVGKDNSLYKLKHKLNARLTVFKNKNIFCNNDVVQLINPIFHTSDLILQNIYVFDLLKKYNKRIYLGAFGDDYYWIEACLRGMYRYDMITNNIVNHTPDEHLFYSLQESFGKQAKILNTYIAKHSEKIIAGLFEYFLPYQKSEFANKLQYLPFPINTDIIQYNENIVKNNKLVFLLGKQRGRNSWKGIDVIESALDNLAQKYPNDIEIIKCESLPFAEYQLLYNKANVVVDQLYSYSPAMNALNALAAGKVVLGGGEPEAYDLLGEKNNTPIFNILPDKIQIENTVLSLIDHRRNIAAIGYNGRRFIEEHHCYLKVAERYLNVWK